MTPFSEETHYVLERWGRWAFDHNRLGYPSETPFRSLLGTTIKSASIADDIAMLADGAISELKKVNRETGEAVALYYLSGCNLSWTAERLKIGRGVADKRVKSGTAWIDGVFHSLCSGSLGISSLSKAMTSSLAFSPS